MRGQWSNDYAMSTRERIPTLRELKLAGRVERARALFGPGGYLYPPSTTPTMDVTPAATLAIGARRQHSGVVGEEKEKEEVVEEEEGAEKIGKGRNNPQRSNVPSKSSTSTAVEDPEEGVGGGARAREGSAPIAEGSSTGSIDTQLPKPAPLPPKDTKARRGDGDDRDESLSPSEPPRNEVDHGTSTAAGFRPGVPTESDGGHHRATAKPVPRGLMDEETRYDGTGEGQQRRGEAGRGGGAVTTVTLTIVGGRPAGRGFTSLEQSGKTPSETVARFIALQAAREGSELLSGGLTHTVTSARWCPTSRGRVLSTWEGYWCHSLSPVFFGRSVLGRHMTKEMARRRQEEDAAAAQLAATPSGPAVSTAVNTSGGESGEEHETPDGTLSSPRPTSSTSVNTNQRLMTPNERLELAEKNYQLLLRRKIKAKRKSGEMARARPFCRRIPLDEVQGWKKEIEDEEQLLRAQRRADNAKRRKERADDSLKRGERNQLKAWLIRHLVASNEGDGDLMAKAIATEGHENDLALSGGYAGKGAPGRESSMSGRNMRPGGRFAYGQEASAEEMKKKDLIIKAQRRFEQETEALLRGVFRSALARTPTPSTAGSSTSNPAPSVELLDEAGTRRTSSSSSSRGAPRPIGRTETVGAKVGADTACAPGSVVSVGDGATSEESRAGVSPEGNDGGTTAATPPATTSTAAAVSPAEQGDPSTAAENLEQSLPDKEVGSRGTAETKVAAGEGRVLGTENANERKTESREKEETRRESSRQDEHAVGVASVPRAEVLRMLRKQGHLRQKAMASDALRPILIDQHFTKGEGDIGPGSCEGRSEGKVVRRTEEASSGWQGDPNAHAPSDAWRAELNISRKANRGDGREWSRFHHHVLIRTSDDLPLYCCLCRRRKWEAARLSRLKGEHAMRTSWEAVLSERQEILEPMVEAVMKCALSMDRALCDNDKGSWAVLHCLENLLRALEEFQDGPARNRRRSRRVSVGPSGFGVATLPNKTSGKPKNEEIGQASATKVESAPKSASGNGSVSTAVMAAGQMSAAVARGRRRGFAEFSEQAQAIATRYYDRPRDNLLTAARATASWSRLREVWFQTEENDLDGLDEAKASSLEACVVETLDKERETWELQENERRSMFAQEESQRRDDEALRRAAEAVPCKTQEVGHRAFCALIDTMERRSQALGRLRWELTASLGDMQTMTTRVRDAATGKRYVCRLLPCRSQEEVEFLLKEAYRTQEIRNPYLVKIHSAHPHRIATYDERGVQTTGGKVVLIQAEFCAGGSLQNHLNLLLGSSGETSTAGRSFDREVERRKVYTPEAESMLKAEEEEKKRRKATNAPSSTANKIAGRSVPWREPLGTRGAAQGGTLSQRLEVWVRQVAHGLSALHADGGMHRNINAQNVFLDERGRAKLGGYQFLKGATSNFAGSLAMHEGFGCAAYAPPEFELRGETSPKGDMWSLGCALYKWTTGKEFAYVAAGARLQDTLHLVPPSYGDKVKAVLFMCLQRDPTVRVTSTDLWKFMATSGDSTVANPVQVSSDPPVAQ
ncbi:Serine/threonine-protein kinase Nek3 (NimA-related protein kinase 3) [Ectocarpus siliculosus]|uniref:Serine/threonine-protein kinase Nek3 (NimA-related protein kinase 3) n=1 Tax=Ectocarpus siliculosus TaxID=2880 RepID=D7G5G5_ECTSI|nr:Serine/threonine-protein kinase Nek3 (NimA-related protein kinase 3) [Ectocarpus siliculosus]|eukprot:CBJ27288.1 Serine/threonine-protein kinase Nek3 (NimA-related protein kinase 3) [Ectocarpus siliculosus]